MRKRIRALFVSVALILIAGFSHLAFAQTETATLSGRVTDPQGAVVPGAEVVVTNIDTNISVSTVTNDSGIYVVPNIRSGRYRLTVRMQGFKEIVKTDIVLHVQDNIALNFGLEVGSVTQSVTVTGDAPLIETKSGTVSTLVDRRFIENMPLNGRSFHTLIELAPGVVLAPAGGSSGRGQISVNGQRTNTNYYTIDGVSANFSVEGQTVVGQEAAGSLPTLSAFGTTSNLVSIDAVEEFRVQTSTYSAEFGRMPGAQISVRTRSGINVFHGTLFEYFRNDTLDASNWFVNSRGLEKPPLRQNDFGGVIGGPLLRDRTFFFFSYEGARVRLPQVAVVAVPSVSARQQAPPSTKPLLDAYPIPNGPDLGGNTAEFAAAWSNPSSLDSYSLRVDHSWRRLQVFGRYSHAPSFDEILNFGFNEFPSKSRSQTLTVGATLTLTPSAGNDFRANWSRNRAQSRSRIIAAAGAVPPPDSAIFPSFTSSEEANAIVTIGVAPSLGVGRTADNTQRQINLVDSMSVVKGSHQFKLGVDYRQLSPHFGVRPYASTVQFLTVDQVIAGTARFITIRTQDSNLDFLFHNLSFFFQDIWTPTPRLTLTYGLRWDHNPPPSEKDDRLPFTVVGLDDPATMTLAPQGTPLWNSSYTNFAPRVGIAYELSPKRGIVLRGGFGIFYDLGNGQSLAGASRYPYARSKSFQNVTWPLSDASAAPPPFTLGPPHSRLIVFEPDLKLPYSMQWNVALEKSLGPDQTLSATYLGALGRRLLRGEQLGGNPNFLFLTVARNATTSDYHALQIQFQRRLSRGLQALASFTWSHSIDDVSNEIAVDQAIELVDLKTRRASSDFDIRHSFTAAITYDIPGPNLGHVGRTIFRDWSVDAIMRARSAPPLNISTGRALQGSGLAARPDLVPGEPIWINDQAAPGGRRLNRDAFSDPSTGQNGSLGRNAVSGFGAWQADVAIRRHFALTERMKLQFRAEFFNLFNHPNFGPPVNNIRSGLFGQATSMLAGSLGQGAFFGGLNPLYQIGGPRSIQLALKLQF